jgi:hypothetical protein
MHKNITNMYATNKENYLTIAMKKLQPKLDLET